MRTFMMLLICFIFLGCAKPKPSILTPPDLPELTSGYNFSLAQTIDNNTYLPLNINGKPSNYVIIILRVENAFEKAHPELAVDYFTLEKQQVSYCRDDFIFGIWVRHHPKSEKEVK